MNRWIHYMIASLAVFAATNLHAVDRYVAWDNAANADTPFTNWATATTNIQDAVDVSVDNDVIWVAPGTYSVPTNPQACYLGNKAGSEYGWHTNIVTLIGHSITLRSSNSIPATTVIDGGGAYRGVYAAPSGGEKIVIDGFSFTNCYANGGAGMLMSAAINSSTSVVQNVVFENNTANDAGGGAYILDTGGTDKDRSFIYVFSNCVFRGNQTTNGSSGALHDGVRGDGPHQGLVVDCTIVSNTAYTKSWSHSGALFAKGNVVFDRCEIGDNSQIGAAVNGRAAVLYSQGPVTLRNCLLYNNSGGYAAIYLNGAELQLQSCTFANHPGTVIQGKEVSTPAHVWGVNTVINDAITVNATCFYSFTNSCVLADTVVDDGVGMVFTNDPGFVDAANNNYRLATGSPCRNTGTNQAWMSSAVDLDGNPRLDSRVPDMGCYEYVTYGTAITVQ